MPPVDRANVGAVFRMRVLALAVAILTAMTVALVSLAAARAARPPTTAYIGKTSAATITPVTPLTWQLENCAGYEGGSVRLGRRHRAITVHYNDGAVPGFALIQRDGSWAIYEWRGGGFYPGNTARLVGLAVQRELTRWDIVRRGRKIGHTVGPDGPEAATAALTIC
jgi:hypothetical protein